jgi:hypothetical protein
MHKLSVLKCGISSGALLLDTFVDVNLRPTKSVFRNRTVFNFALRVNGSEKISVALILRRYGSDCSLSQMASFDNDSSWPISLSGTFSS